MMLKFAFRIGAIFYGIWGLLHIPIGYSVYMGGMSIADRPKYQLSPACLKNFQKCVS